MIQRLQGTGEPRAMELAQVPALVLTVTPALVQYAHLLAMGMDEVEQLVAAEAAENPALEIAEVSRCQSCGGTLIRSTCVTCSAPGGADAYGRSPAPPVGPTDPPAREMASSLHDVLMELGPFGRRIADYVIGNLTSRGLLDGSPGRIAADLGIATSDVLEVIERLRGATEPGFAASSVEECLLLQLHALDDCADADKRLGAAVIEGHLDALARGDVESVARSLGISVAAVKRVHQLIRARLHAPTLGSLDGSARPTLYVTPDVIVTLDGDDLRVEIVERHRLRLAVDDAFRWASAKVGRGDAVHDLAARARAFIERLEGRWRTLQRIAEATVSAQETFVRGGPEHLRPLTRAQIAEREGLHESTVSRATRDKFVLLPSRELVPFARFFDAAAAPKEALKRILARSERPRTDSQLARALADQGFQMSRRTAAKYRRELGFSALNAR